MAKLTDKQKRFCKEYIIDLNATQAALRAGYCANTVNQSGPANLVKIGIQCEISRLMAKREERTQITADNVVLELGKIGFSNIEDYLTVDEDGETRLKSFEGLERATLAAIESIKISTTKNKDDSREYTTTQFKLCSKLNALEQLGKHLGIFIESAPHPEREKARLKRTEMEIEEIRRITRIRTDELSRKRIESVEVADNGL